MSDKSNQENTISGTLQARAMAVQIILEQPADDCFSQFIEDYSIGGTGDYESHWNQEKLKKAFCVGSEYEQSPANKMVEFADRCYWDAVMNKEKHEMFKDLVGRLIKQIEADCISTGRGSALESIKTYL